MKTSTSTGTGAFEGALQSIRSRLERERGRLCREIRQYPTPIPRCDAQFNHLLEQRDAVVRELQRLEDIAGVGSAADANRLIEALIDEAGLSDAVKRELRSIAGATRSDSTAR
jgi:hypothetical protein